MYKSIKATPAAYNRITFFGDITIDNVWIRERILSDAEINAMNYKIAPTWTSDTIFLALFEHNSINAGNIINLTSPIISWDIYRKTVEENILTYLTTVDHSIKTYVDFTTQAYKTYIYEIFPITATEIGDALQTAPLYTDYFGYYLIDPDDGTVYKFDLNISSGEFQYEEDVTVYKTYVQYPAVTKGKTNYLKNTITALAGTISCTEGFLQPIDYINTLEAFITNGKIKLYKTRKGGIYKVYTRNFHYKILENDGIVEQPMLITFDVFEVEAV
jgi:hypothetical protein